MERFLALAFLFLASSVSHAFESAWLPFSAQDQPPSTSDVQADKTFLMGCVNPKSEDDRMIQELTEECRKDAEIENSTKPVLVYRLHLAGSPTCNEGKDDVAQCLVKYRP